MAQFDFSDKPVAPEGHREVYVLKVFGKHNLVFKTKHEDPEYLKKVGEELITQKDTHFTTYEIVYTYEANEELTHPEFLIHPVND
ncbi:MAG: hypothetical protein R3219_02185 [Hydrogenovibrio sp.]|nr:hypothetical protein [Hydrogenovibrio sp.]